MEKVVDDYVLLQSYSEEQAQITKELDESMERWAELSEIAEASL